MYKKKMISVIKPLVEMFPHLAMTYRHLRDSKDLSNEPKFTPLGFKFSGNYQMEMGLFEPSETELVKRIFPKVEFVINIGANVGYYACLALQKNKKVIAFEPMQSNLKYLMRNIKANCWQKNCEILPVALSDEIGIVEIYGGGTGASLIEGWANTSKGYATLVPCTTLNDTLGNKLNGKSIFFIVDIEGSEYRMLEGASRLLDMIPKPIWLIEISGKEHQPKGLKINPFLLQTFEMLWSKGYESIAADNSLRPVTREEILNIVATGNDTLGTHNFLFFDGNDKPI